MKEREYSHGGAYTRVARSGWVIVINGARIINKLAD